MLHAALMQAFLVQAFLVQALPVHRGLKAHVELELQSDWAEEPASSRLVAFSPKT